MLGALDQATKQTLHSKLASLQLLRVLAAVASTIRAQHQELASSDHGAADACQKGCRLCLSSELFCFSLSLSLSCAIGGFLVAL